MAGESGRSRKPRCPICGKPATEAHIPFCSTRCVDIDLGRWLGGEYRIPTDERPDATAPDPEREE
jgi:endogenous inhibitor of DNA gyrase (YacG/DUF329 family)